MKGTLVFLGTGGSSGIPMIGCKCPVCQSTDPHNKRMRTSAFVKIGKTKLVIDTGPDFRQQALLHGLDTISGILLTHAHFDHTAGIDELRSYYLIQGLTLPILVSRATYEDLKMRFYYLFQKKSWGKSLAAQLDFHILEEEKGSTDFLGIRIRYMTYSQGGMKVLGYRIGNFAYISDIRDYTEDIFDDLKDVDLLVVSALRKEASPLHFTLDEAVRFVQRVQPKQAFFTHIAHELDHAKTNAELPPGISLAYDGLKVEFSYDAR